LGRRVQARARWLAVRPALIRQLAARDATLDIVEAGDRPHSRRLARGLPAAGETSHGGPARWPRYAMAAAASVAITLAAAPLRDTLDPANTVMLFLLGTVGVALRFGRGPSALAAVLNVAAFDFFFVEPRLSFVVTDVQYLLTFGIMLGVGLLVGQLTAGLRFQAGVAASREHRAHALFELSRDLSGALLASQVVALGQAAVRGQFGGEALVLVADAADALVPPQDPPAGFDASVADWAFRNGQSAGLGTGTLAAQDWHYLPLRAPMRIRGVLALRPSDPRGLLAPEQQRQLDTLARQVAIALERVHYVEVAQQAVLEMESEQLRNALLAAISHDVRTPLTAVIGLAEMLERSQPTLSPAQLALTQGLAERGRQLATLVTNLLELARLQGGKVRLGRDWQSVEELVGGALQSAASALDGMAVVTDVPPDLPLVEFDAVLLERVLANLLENAAKYGGAPITLRARTTGDS
ncbi:MAG: DUF4118 domain-containing protein, partial [Comamonadaceae bacterium]